MSFVSGEQHHVKKRHVYIHVCSYVEAQLFIFCCCCCLRFMPSMKLFFFFSLVSAFFADNKKAVFTFNILPIFIQHRMAWGRAGLCKRQGAESGADARQCQLAWCASVATAAGRKEGAVHVWIEYEIGLCCSWNVNMKNYRSKAAVEGFRRAKNIVNALVEIHWESWDGGKNRWFGYGFFGACSVVMKMLSISIDLELCYRMLW